MRFFHLSDLHIGLRLLNRDMQPDQIHILDQIAEYVKKEQPDAVVIAGDIYDKAVPSAEAVGIFDRFVNALNTAAPDAEILVISGNHDSAARVNIFRNVLCRHHIHMVGLPPMLPDEHIEKVTLKDEYGNIDFYLLPFVKPSAVRAVTGPDDNGNSLSYEEAVRRLIEREDIDETGRNVLVSHQFYLPAGADPSDIERMDSEIVTVGNIDSICSDVLKKFDYAALGHIHKPMKAGGEFFRYCGTPLACSFSEAGQKKGILSVEMKEKGNVRTELIPLVPLHPVRIVKGEIRDLLENGSEDYVKVVITDKGGIAEDDVIERIRAAYPNLLLIERENIVRNDYGGARFSEGSVPDAFELCRAFLNEPDEGTCELLRDVINTVKEGGR